MKSNAPKNYESRGVFMQHKIDLHVPMRNIILKILAREPDDPPIFGHFEDRDDFFRDLVTLGFDFYELLELYLNANALTEATVSSVVQNLPPSDKISRLSRSQIRRMVPHWTSSPYHTATINIVCEEISNHITNRDNGVFVYNSNLNEKRPSAHNDIYILIITELEKVLVDIRRRKTFKISFNEEGSSC